MSSESAYGLLPCFGAFPDVKYSENVLGKSCSVG